MSPPDHAYLPIDQHGADLLFQWKGTTDYAVLQRGDSAIKLVANDLLGIIRNSGYN